MKNKKSPKPPKISLPQIDDDNPSVPDAPRNTEVAHLPAVQSGESLSSLATDASTLHVRDTPGSGLGLFDPTTASPIERVRSPFFGFARSREHSPERLDPEQYVIPFLTIPPFKHVLPIAPLLGLLNTFNPARVGGNITGSARSDPGEIFHPPQHTRHLHPLANPRDSSYLVNKKQPTQTQRERCRRQQAGQCGMVSKSFCMMARKRRTSCFAPFQSL